MAPASTLDIKPAKPSAVNVDLRGKLLHDFWSRKECSGRFIPPLCIALLRRRAASHAQACSNDTTAVLVSPASSSFILHAYAWFELNESNVCASPNTPLDGHHPSPRSHSSWQPWPLDRARELSRFPSTLNWKLPLPSEQRLWGPGSLPQADPTAPCRARCRVIAADCWWGRWRVLQDLPTTLDFVVRHPRCLKRKGRKKRKNLTTHNAPSLKIHSLCRKQKYGDVLFQCQLLCCYRMNHVAVK